MLNLGGRPQTPPGQPGLQGDLESRLEEAWGLPGRLVLQTPCGVLGAGAVPGRSLVFPGVPGASWAVGVQAFCSGDEVMVCLWEEDQQLWLQE